jgi:hypothetical protein
MTASGLKLVLEFANAISRTPAELRDRLLTRFTPAQATELAATAAWDSNRGRLNQALGVQPAGFSRAPRARSPSGDWQAQAGPVGREGSVRRIWPPIHRPL